MRIRALLALGTVAGCLCIFTMTARATGSQVELNILPMNCVFETVDDGSNTLHYLTPEACGQVDEGASPTLLVQETAPLSNSPSAGITVQSTQRPAAVFAGLTNIEFVGDKTWTPITAAPPAGIANQQATRVALTMTASIASVVSMVGLALDIVLFEMRHTKSMLRWTRRFITRKP